MLPKVGEAVIQIGLGLAGPGRQDPRPLPAVPGHPTTPAVNPAVPASPAQGTGASAG